MLKLTQRQFAIIFISMTVLFFAFNNCGVVETPTSGKLNFSSTFSHQGISQGCTSCHDTGKSFSRFPATGHQAIAGQDCNVCHSTASWKTANPHGPGAQIPTTCFSCHAAKVPVGFVGTASLSGNLTPVGGLFDHAKSGSGGSGDCVTCHTSKPENVGVSWTGGIYSHSPTPTSCIGCHTNSQRPTGLVGPSPGFNHANGGTGDCIGCHASVPSNIGRTWMLGKFGHSPAPTACATCHLSDSNYIAVQNLIKNQMSHGFKGLPDCASCHSGAASASGWKSWQNETVANGNNTARTDYGIFHTNFPATPDACVTCHINERPTGLVGNPAFDHSTSTSVDCAVCHRSVPTNIGKSWAGASFSHAGVTTCVGCHASARPTGLKGSVSLLNNLTPIGGLFDHSGNGGTGDCSVCHTSKPQNIGTTWAGGVYSHTPKPSSCFPCHTSAQRPIGPVGNPAFDHANGGTGDCFGCHSSNTANIGRTWAQGSFGHSPTPTSCATCHLSDNTYINVQNIIKNQMSHLVPGLPDCANCHSPAAVANKFTSWVAESVVNGNSAARTSLGVFHSIYGSTPKTCQNCHANERPQSPAGATLFDHKINGAGDCVSCHTTVAANIGKTWAQGSFSHSPAPVTCASCHISDPTYTSIKNTITKQMNHQVSGLPDCAQCHSASAISSSFTSWAVPSTANGTSTDRASLGVFHTNFTSSFTSCQTCHSNERPTALVGTTSFNHSTNGAGDCLSCHSSVAANIGKTWKGGKFSHVGVTTCISCHANRVPSGTVPNTQNGFTHATNFGTECSTCHSVVPANVGVTWSKGYFGHAGNSVSGVGNTCSPCHDTKKHFAGQLCTTCHATSKGLKWPTPSSSGNFGGEWGSGQ